MRRSRGVAQRTNLRQCSIHAALRGSVAKQGKHDVCREPFRAKLCAVRILQCTILQKRPIRLLLCQSDMCLLLSRTFCALQRECVAGRVSSLRPYSQPCFGTSSFVSSQARVADVHLSPTSGWILSLRLAIGFRDRHCIVRTLAARSFDGCKNVRDTDVTGSGAGNS